MKTWQWKMKFADVRICTVLAETEEEARRKMDSGDWESEDTVDFYADEQLEDLREVEE